MGDECMQVLIGKSAGAMLLEKHMRKEKNNIRIYLK
jgi:hypothetical protein